jgi:translation initiation factor IF-2
MRVYEYAKEIGSTSKDVLAALKLGGFDASTHMAVLSPEALAHLKKLQAKKASPAPAVIEKAKSAPTPPPVQRPSQPQARPTTPQPQPAQSRNQSPSQTVPTPVAAATASTTSSKETKTTMTEHFTQEKAPQPVIIPSLKPTVHTEIIEEETELKEQERIKRLLQSTAFVNLPVGQGGQPAPRRRRRRRPRFAQQQQQQEVLKPVTEATVSGGMPLFEVADLFRKQASELITTLLKKGQVCNRNHVLTLDIIKSLAHGYNITLNVQQDEQATATTAAVAAVKVNAQAGSTGVSRAPVVVVMGHVDHGKTTLLDYIRKMKVAASEKGGITQHITAWEVTSKSGKIVFLDTPGHEAFSFMRQRGSSITDIAVLVVAADDGVMPQTVEALKHAQSVGVPIIVAINKIDKAQSQSALETIKRQLSQYGLMSEDWGGETVFVPVSGKTGQGVDGLLEMISLQAQMMELKADASKPAKGFILESHVERGFGPVATVVIQEGTLKRGDFFVSGASAGKVRILLDSNNKRIERAGPSTPVQVVGFENFAGIGETLNAVQQVEYLKVKAQKAVEAMPSGPPVAQNLNMIQNTAAAAGNKKFINLIIKTDTRGSKEAIMESIDKVIKTNKEIKCPINIIATNIGDITEGDVDLASNTGAMILALHVKVEKNAMLLSKEKGVVIQNHEIIYQMIDYVTSLLLSKKEAVITWNKVGEAAVKKVFDIKGIGVIAGCYMREGSLTRGNKVICMRAGKQVGEGKVSSLQRDRKTVKEVHAGFECGFTCDGFNEWQEGDIAVCYQEIRTV